MKKNFVLIAITAFLCHVLLTGAAASDPDDSVLTVNPSAEPLAQEAARKRIAITAARKRFFMYVLLSASHRCFFPRHFRTVTRLTRMVL